MRRARGFSLIELLIVVGTLGILAMIAVPSLLSAVYRGKQKRTMADMRSVAAAVTAYSVDLDFVPLQTTPGPLDAVQDLLQPTYMKSVPLRDGWSRDFVYVSDARGNAYTLVSYGKDGVPSGPLTGVTTAFGDDLVIADGSFIAWPEGTQSE